MIPFPTVFLSIKSFSCQTVSLAPLFLCVGRKGLAQSAQFPCTQGAVVETTRGSIETRSNHEVLNACALSLDVRARELSHKVDFLFASLSEAGFKWHSTITMIGRSN
ncbi:hypothetical protein K505DRAFT_155831 [Melanomma pulvis-pyrius CBS 109.77]|uniref:Uncharacterized protein n=1 Tax=Melanomma pulvis-pyrius CBS 109.77 TaxID=1314802 RepID=A0A6A6XK90_9PLEO|nr:hypothetical protein K505DRAFT_155831 [Melanomma pulvis-pyrius CBS 109.77]